MDNKIRELLNYQGHKVYTSSSRFTTNEFLQNSKACEGTIFDAFFYKIKKNGGFEQIEFDREKLENPSNGLMVGIDVKLGSKAFIDFQSLEYIDTFLSDAEASVENLESLKNKKAVYYESNGRLMGFYLDKN